MLLSAAKYKIYSRLRTTGSPSSDKIDQSTSMPCTQAEAQSAKSPRKRCCPSNADDHEHNLATPRKISKRDLFTPSKARVVNLHPSQLDPYESPSALRQLFSPHVYQHSPSPLPLRTALGPTPQRDGKALGLFDLLSASGGSTTTPCTRNKGSAPADVAHTPSRIKIARTPRGQDAEVVCARKHSLTPASSGKKFFLSNFFVSPSTVRYAAIIGNGED